MGGKKLLAVRVMKHTLEIIHLLTDLNPIQVVVNAIINGGPREDSTRIGSAGVVRRQAVDVSPLRRVNQAIYLLVTGARESSFRSIKTIAECLADESSTQRRAPPTATRSRRRTSSSALPSPTVKRIGALFQIPPPFLRVMRRGLLAGNPRSKIHPCQTKKNKK